MDNEQRAKTYAMMAAGFRRIVNETEFTEIDVSVRWSNGDLIMYGQGTIGRRDGDGYLVRVAEASESVEGFWVEREALRGVSTRGEEGE